VNESSCYPETETYKQEVCSPYNELPTIMKKLTALILISFSIINCTSFKEKDSDINPENYFSFETVSYERNGKINTFVSPTILKRTDSIGNFISNHQSRFSYILGNRIERDTLKTFYPDTSKVELQFKENLKKDKFYLNFKKLALLELTKERYNKEEIMNIASRFFLIQKSPNGTGYGTRICTGINGLEKQTEKDYTVLEAVMFDAIFNRAVADKKPKAEFLNSLEKYKINITTQETKLENIRQSIYATMANDENLNLFVFEYLEKNKENIPFEIK
jgi:hypothetical protein